MKYGLKDTDIQKIQRVFEAFPEVEKVILYGSRAKGNYKPGSDIDFTLIGNKLDLTITNSIEHKIDDLLLPYLFDISIFEQISNQDLIKHINRVGEVFYEKSKNAL
jgi:predicted nucleotidyltransferase